MTAARLHADNRAVVVGASLAGLRAAESLRKNGFSGEIVIVGAERHMPYNRPPLSKAPLDEPVEPEWLKPNRAVAEANWRLGARVVASDLDRGSVTLDSGETLSWDGLVIATGLRPRTLDLAGPTAGRYVLRSVDHANQLRKALIGARRLVVVGAGFVGCEIAALAASAGMSVHVVAPESVALERPLGEFAGAEIQRRLEELGVTFHMRALPVRYEGGAAVDEVVLSNLDRLPADVVVEAVGSVPDCAWLGGNGLDLSDGVLCNDFMQVPGRPGVVVCGDVARFPHRAYDDVPRRVEHWSTAVDTARKAGAVLAGHLTGTCEPTDAFTSLPSFWSHLSAIRIQSFGMPSLGMGDVRVLEGSLTNESAIGYFRDNELVGVVLVGMATRYMHYRREAELAGARLGRRQER
ncbi:NAD(P)/FAD-dependent oxidoreductase [Nocardia jiangxiensis]|uniref:NAD(P)/FAD-dependent oxidoreductase n=1 Tax=Nocardia jiangxiensis TaxID=282685 RepID=UPI00030A835B|nr:NAD(P)/FAD-dependent oxidoreductase [Nocardia jiangxiensis]